jgi:hypothetical protein
MNELVKVDPKEYGLSDSSAVEIEKAFLPKIAEREGYQEVYNLLLTKEINKETCIEARELRLKLVKIRTGIGEIHKTQKAYFLRAGQFVDAWKNKETLPVEQMEENLEKIEKHFAIQEAEKIAKIAAERKVELLQYTSEFLLPDRLGEMPESIYQNYLVGIKVAFDAKVKADREAEELLIENERIDKLGRERQVELYKYIQFQEEIYSVVNLGIMSTEDYTQHLIYLEGKKTAYETEQARIHQENERLKAEAIEREKKAEAERKRQADLLAKQKAEADKKARIEKEKQDAILAKERAEAKRIQDAIEEKARIEREKAEAERKALQDQIAKKEAEERRVLAEAKIKEAERIAAEKQALKAPDKTKMVLWINNCTLPELKLSNMESIIVAQEIDAKFELFKKWAVTKIEAL